MKKGFWFALGYGLLLTAFTTYVLMDSFTISRVYTPVPPPPTFQAATLPNLPTEPNDPASPSMPTNPDAPSDPVTYPIITENSYIDEYINITLTEYREYDTSIYVADIRVSDVRFLKAAFAKDQYGKNIKEKTSDMAKNKNAILAINGDYYGSRDVGYVLRNGLLYRDKGANDREDLIIWPDGRFGIAYERNTSAKSLLDEGAWQVFSFGPALVKNSRISVDVDTEVGQATYSNPRTAIAMVDKLHYLMVVSDGRTDRSEGLTLYQLAEFLQSKGATLAYNLDGGGSSTMYFNGRVVNEPVNHGSTVSERSISDIVYIGY
jgi:exopolysaccharide biosynthesis protein